MRHVVIVGHGMAGARLAAELRAHRPTDLAVTVFGEETGPAYNRILLSALLAGTVREPDIALAEHTGHPVTVHRGETVTAIDPGARTVTTDGPDGRRRVRYDQLVLATGSRPVTPKLAGLDPRRLPPRVATFRNLADCRRILATIGDARTALVLGGGLLGVEAACGLARRGLRTRLVHALDRLMERQLDNLASTVLVGTLHRLGITTELNATAVGVSTHDGHEGRVGLLLDDQRMLSADLLVVACGVRPDTRLANAAGLRVRHGVIVDDRLRTSDPRIFALGDCAEHDGVVSGLVSPAWEQAKVLSAGLTGDSRARYRPSPAMVRLKTDGVDLAAIGVVDTAAEQVTFADPARGTYARLAIDDDRLVGAIMLGDNPTVGSVIQLLDRGAPVPADRRRLLLGQPAGAPGPGAAALTQDTAVVCQCNMVRGRDLAALWRAGARSVEDMIAATHATTGCGTCRESVEGVVESLAMSAAAVT